MKDVFDGEVKQWSKIFGIINELDEKPPFEATESDLQLFEYLVKAEVASQETLQIVELGDGWK